MKQMKPPNLYLISTTLLPLILFPVSWLPTSVSDNLYEGFKNCKQQEYTCGSLKVNISYPFRIDNRPDYCGKTGYYLVCTGDKLTITVNKYVYRVRGMDYDNHNLNMVDDIDNSLDEGSCPLARANTSIDTSLYTYSERDINLTIYHNCTGPTPSPTVRPISCAEKGKDGLRSYYKLGWGNIVDVKRCNSTYLVAVDRNAWNDIEDGNISSALKQGFSLKWIAGKGWCRNCTLSGGLCGFNPNSTTDQTCYCPNGIVLGSCDQDASTSKKSVNYVKIFVVAAIGGALLISAILLFVYQQKRRWKRSSLAMLLRASSAEPSSKKDPEMGAEYPTQTFSYSELEEATDGFSASLELGDGGFGTVYKGKLRDGRTVAVKRLYQNNYKRMEQFINEIHILSFLRHQNLVTLYGCSSRHSRELLLVYEYIPNGTVADHLHGPRAEEGALTWPVRLSIAIEAADALAYLHAVEPQIIHRDVKTNNILLDMSFHVKVADFGLSRLFPVDATHVSTAPQGTPGYVDPEYHQCYQLTDKSDVYSFGVVLVELISSKPAVDISRHRSEINLSNMAMIKIQNNELDQLVDSKLGFETDMEVKCMITQVAELAFRCLQSDREMRPPIKGSFGGVEDY